MNAETRALIERLVAALQPLKYEEEYFRGSLASQFDTMAPVRTITRRYAREATDVIRSAETALAADDGRGASL